MNAFFAILAILISVGLILLVVVQNSKGGGLSSAFGASNLSSMVGARRAAEEIEKWTWYAAVGLAVIAFVANMFVGDADSKPEQLRTKQQIENSDFNPAQQNRSLPGAE